MRPVLVVIGCIVFIAFIAIRRARQNRVSGVPPAQTLSLQALDLSDASGECDFHIVGESNYQPELRRVSRSGRTFLAIVALERDNPKDKNAIRVIAEGGKTIGYLSREYAIDYREVFELLERHSWVGACRAKLIGGIGEKKSFGVMLNLKDPETILTDIRDTLAPGTAVADRVQPF